MIVDGARRQALEFKRWLLHSVATDPRITRDVRGRVARELDALEGSDAGGDWEARRKRHRAQPYALSCPFAGWQARLDAIRLALSSPAGARPLEVRFLGLVGGALSESAESALDVLFGCFPLLETLCSVEGQGIEVRSGKALEAAVVTQSARASREQRFLLLELGQQCSAWFTTESELVAALSRLWA